MCIACEENKCIGDVKVLYEKNIVVESNPTGYGK